MELLHDDGAIIVDAGRIDHGQTTTITTAMAVDDDGGDDAGVDVDADAERRSH